jgi:hypothetical protein
MSNQPILDSIDPEIVETLVSRRDAIVKSGKIGGGMAAALALGSAPVALGAFARSAYAQTGGPTDVLNALQFALLLENFEAELYSAVLNLSTVPAFNTAFNTVRATFSAVEAATFRLIRDHEVAHVQFLRTTITALGGTLAPYNAAATFDFTGGRGTGTGPFAPATTDKAFLLLVAQVVEDTGVRAYKGQAGNLMSNNNVLQAGLQIHAVEARHAAKIRRMRRIAGLAGDVVRLSGTIRGGAAGAAGAQGSPPTAVVNAANLIYGGATPESNTVHTVFNGTANANVDANALGLTFGLEAAQEAFDEALTRAEVVAIVQPFVIPTIS